MNITDTLSFGEQMNFILHDPITLVLILAILDVISGTIASIYNKEYKSSVFKKGVITHIFIILGLYLFQFYAADYSLEPLLIPFSTAFILMYISSLYENYKKFGGQELPEAIDKLIPKKKEKTEDELE